MRAVVVIVVLVIGAVAGVLIDRSGFALKMGSSTTEKGGDAAAPSAAGAPAKVVRWKLASAYSSTTPIIGALATQFIDTVNVVTGGEVNIRFYEPGALVPALEVFDAVSSGSVDVGYATPGFWAGKKTALQLFSSVPFGPAAPEYMAWMYYGGGQELLDAIYAKHNIKSLLCAILPPEASGWFREEITSLDQLKGLKMRFFALGALVMEKLGASTQLLAGGDIYPALELGTIDATEYSSPAIDLGLGFYQVAKHYYFPGWHQQSTWADMIFNLDSFNALSPANQRRLEVVCGDLVRESLAWGEAAQIPALAELSDHGVMFHKWPQEFLDAFETAWAEVAAEEAEKDADFKRAWESLAAFREKFKPWRDLGYLK